MKLICVNEEYQHYFIADDEPQPKLNNKEMKNYTDTIYSLMGYTKKKIKLFGITLYTYYSSGSSSCSAGGGAAGGAAGGATGGAAGGGNTPPAGGNKRLAISIPSSKYP